MKTLKLNKTFAVLMLACMTLASADLFAQYSGLRIEDDGFSWNRVCQDGKEGAKSTNGSWIIPLSRGYTDICYHTGNGGWFHVEKNSDSWGACDKNGREIVAPGRYDKVYYYNNRKDGYVYCYVELNGKMGVCDENGREVIAPRYEDLCYDDFFDHVFQYKDASGNYVSLGNPLQKSSSSAYASSSTTGGSSSSSSGGKSGGSSSSGGKSGGSKLLYKGWYNGSPSVLNGMESPDVIGPYVIEIYEKEIHIVPGYTYYINGPMKYSMFTSQGVCADVFVDNNYNLTLHKYHPVGTEIKKYTRADSSPVNTSQGGYYGGGGTGTYTGGNTGNDGNKGNTTTTQPKQHKCGVCGGTGREIRTDAASFGKTKYCSECGKTVPDYHYHAPCRSCGGKGWW